MGRGNNRSKLYLLAIPLGLLLMGAGYAINSQSTTADAGHTTGFHSTTMTGPYRLTQQRIEWLNSHTSAIYTHFGVFYRSTAAMKFPEGEIAHGEDNVNSHTKEIITDYGTFVKTS